MPDNKIEDTEGDDLAKDMQFADDAYVNMEGENHSMAKEGSLKTPEEDKHQQENLTGQSKDAIAPADQSGKTSLAEDEKLSTDEISG